MPKIKRKGLIAGIIILLFVAVALLLIATLPVLKNSIHYDNSNTVEHSATFKNLISKDKSYEIEVDEYSCSLFFQKKK